MAFLGGLLHFINWYSILAVCWYLNVVSFIMLLSLFIFLFFFLFSTRVLLFSFIMVYYCLPLLWCTISLFFSLNMIFGAGDEVLHFEIIVVESCPILYHSPSSSFAWNLINIICIFDVYIAKSRSICRFFLRVWRVETEWWSFAIHLARAVQWITSSPKVTYIPWIITEKCLQRKGLLFVAL